MTKKKSKFKSFVKGVDKYYTATKQGLTSAGRDIKSGYHTFTGAVHSNLNTLNESGFAKDFRHGLNKAVPYMEKKFKTHIFQIYSPTDFNTASLKVIDFNIRYNKNLKLKQLYIKGGRQYAVLEFEYPVTKSQAIKVFNLIGLLEY
jgi:hypothetical protein